MSGYKPYSILFKFPTMGRKDKFFNTLDIYYNNIADKSNSRFVISMESSDSDMNNDLVKNRLNDYYNLSYYFGNNDSKISACNADMRGQEFDIVVLASDDQIPIVKGFDDIIREKMRENFSDLDGCLWFNDGYTKDKLNTLCIIGKKYYDRFNYIYHPAYRSLWSDNEFTEIAIKLNKIKYFDNVIIKHEHPFNNGNMSVYDFVYNKNDKMDRFDRVLFAERKSQNFDMGEYEKKWSILILTLEKRREKFNYIIGRIKSQIRENNLSKNINILISSDNGEKIVGLKRQELIRACKSEYCCFIDDDDDVSDDYIKLMWEGINTNPDCISLEGIITTMGKNPKKFIHNLKYNKYFEKDNVYYRPPNHLNVMKTKFFKRYLFREDMKTGEDTDFAMRLCKSGDLKTQYEVGKPYYFYNYNPIK